MCLRFIAAKLASLAAELERVLVIVTSYDSCIGLVHSSVADSKTSAPLFERQVAFVTAQLEEAQKPQSYDHSGV